MTIHFICLGNTYRSRLAETYLNSKQIPNLKGISSGVSAEKNERGPITWYAQRLIQRDHLIPFEKANWQQTTKTLLAQGDYTVFMKKDIYEMCVKNYGFDSKKFEIWNITDLHSITGSLKSDVERVEFSEKTYDEIKRKVDELLKTIS
jgi:protein-tyrosine-phosphatase